MPTIVLSFEQGGFLREVEGHHYWFGGILAQLKSQQAEFVRCLRDSVNNSPVTTHTWQDHLDRLLLPPPAKRRRIGADMYYAPQVSVPMPAVASPPSEYDELGWDYL